VIATNGIGGGVLIIGVWTRPAASLNAAVLLLGVLIVYVRPHVLLKGPLLGQAIGRGGARDADGPPPAAGPLLRPRGGRRVGRQEVATEPPATGPAGNRGWPFTTKGGTHGTHEGVRRTALPGGRARSEDPPARRPGRHGGGWVHLLSAGTLRGCEASRR